MMHEHEDGLWRLRVSVRGILCIEGKGLYTSCCGISQICGSVNWRLFS